MRGAGNGSTKAKTYHVDCTRKDTLSTVLSVEELRIFLGELLKLLVPTAIAALVLDLYITSCGSGWPG